MNKIVSDINKPSEDNSKLGAASSSISDSSDLDKLQKLENVFIGIGEDACEFDPKGHWIKVHDPHKLYAQILANYRSVADIKKVVGKKELGETVQVECPDLKPGCLVYHTAFKMTHSIKHRNELRKEILSALIAEREKLV